MAGHADRKDPRRHPGLKRFLAAMVSCYTAVDFTRPCHCRPGRRSSARAPLAYEDPGMLSLQAESTDEAIAFLYAAIDQLPEAYADYYLTRTVVVTDPDMARSLASVDTSLIIALIDADIGLAKSLTDKGHHVLIRSDLGLGCRKAR